ncbi:MAG: hypothetical protein MRK02_17835 [Candidatus Scalindua sp.]|nr:hypothetical protein [Candidatus Scalindua sp.]
MVVLNEKNVVEDLAPVIKLRNVIILLGVLIVIVTGTAAISISRGITGSIKTKWKE